MNSILYIIVILIIFVFQTHQKRGDYLELAELVVMFLGGKRARFHKPGNISHARFMCKALYYPKLHMLSDMLSPLMENSPAIEEEINRVNEFVCIFWAVWFLTAEFPTIAAPQVKKRKLNSYAIFSQNFLKLNCKMK